MLGDMMLNRAKLGTLLGAIHLRPATAEEIVRTGAIPGYASPVGLERARVTVVVGDAAEASSNRVAGVNGEGRHLLNTNVGRDYEADIVADIATAQARKDCPKCGAPLSSQREIEVGHIFKLGTRYSEALGATFVGKDGKRRPLLMGSYGIGPGRVLACVAEAKSDELGLV